MLLGARCLGEDGDGVFGGVRVQGDGFGDGVDRDASSAENGQGLRLANGVA